MRLPVLWLPCPFLALALVQVYYHKLGLPSLSLTLPIFVLMVLFLAELAWAERKGVPDDERCLLVLLALVFAVVLGAWLVMSIVTGQVA